MFGDQRIKVSDPEYKHIGAFLKKEQADPSGEQWGGANPGRGQEHGNEEQDRGKAQGRVTLHRPGAEAQQSYVLTTPSSGARFGL